MDFWRKAGEGQDGGDNRAAPYCSIGAAGVPIRRSVPLSRRWMLSRCCQIITDPPSNP